MYLLGICKIIVSFLLGGVFYSAESTNIPDFPDLKTFINSLGRIAEGKSLSADEMVSIQSFVFNQSYAGEVARLLMRPEDSPLLSLRSHPANRGLFDGTIIPLENRGNTFENFHIRTPYADKAKQLAKTFIDTPLKKGQSQFMYWQGPSGRGKTHLAVSVAKTLVSSGKKVLFLSGSKMHSYFQGMYRTVFPLNAEQYFGTYDMVIIDALNSIDSVQFMYLKALLFDIAFDRGGLKVIITSNMDVNSFIESFSLGSTVKDKLTLRYYSSRIDVLLDCAPSNGVIDFSRLSSMRG
jgi:hypothetical protein